jgi:anthranilate synthase component 1
MEQNSSMNPHEMSITVKAQYLPDQSDPDNRQFAFAYTVTIRNTGTASIQLIARHWFITDGDNDVQEVKGLGVVYADPSIAGSFENAQGRLKELLACLGKPANMPASLPSTKTDLIRKFKAADFENAVLKTKEYILAGDCMQVVIGQRISKPFTDSPLALYRALRSLNPSPYMYFYDFGDMQIVGSSPEILVRQEKRAAEKIVTIRPLAGTRPRGANPEEDERLAKELLADPKEIAEHVMLIDLARNDVGRIAKTGSVKVTDSMSIEKYSHVQHIVSSVEGDLLDNMSNMDVLRATFPAGTLSGAPKIRAMEIIDEMEIVKRGVYGGAVGYLSFSGGYGCSDCHSYGRDP